MHDLDLETLIDTASELQRQVLDALGDHVRRCGEEAEETGRAVGGASRLATKADYSCGSGSSVSWAERRG